ncbi:6-pyruvoyl trahydropterin synthase family protein [Nonomuraea dietziae]|uniref:6-pyruvoyl trahydropterin synthase family protein n=1 Tax=Nonomuraea dietziae TaxID=65515 RepID=UPI0033FD7D83
MYTQTVDHTFHAAHSLPHLAGKCSSLHGHTWRVSITIAGPSLDKDGVLVEFGAFKKQMIQWIDTRLDHSLMLGTGDNLVPLLRPTTEHWDTDNFAPSPLAKAFDERGQRLFIFGRDFPDIAWPSVEGVAQLLAHHAHTWLDTATTRRDVHVHTVTVRETDNNAATWHNPNPEPASLSTRSLRAALDGRRKALASLAHRHNLGPDTVRQLLEDQAPALVQQIVQETGVDADSARVFLTGEMRRTLGELETLVDTELHAWLKQSPAPNSN